MRPLLVLLLLVNVVAGCDRFADEPRGLVVVVEGARGTPLQGVEVHARYHFAPAYDSASSLPLYFEIERPVPARYRALRKSDGASYAWEPLDDLAPGTHKLDVSDFDLPNGVYRAEVQAGNWIVLDEDFVLNRTPQQYDKQRALARTPPDGKLYFTPEALFIGTTALLPDGDAFTLRTVTDSLTFIFLRPGQPPQTRSVRLYPDGITRLAVSLE